MHFEKLWLFFVFFSTFGLARGFQEKENIFVENSDCFAVFTPKFVANEFWKVPSIISSIFLYFPRVVEATSQVVAMRCRLQLLSSLQCKMVDKIESWIISFLRQWLIRKYKHWFALNDRIKCKSKARSSVSWWKCFFYI